MKKIILIYDDDEEILLLCKLILEKNGFLVKTSSRCNDVLTDIRQHDPAIILMDLWIPTIGGQKAIEIIKSSDYANTPVLAFSANPDIDEISKKVKADGFIRKPFDVKEFIATVQKVAGV